VTSFKPLIAWALTSGKPTTLGKIVVTIVTIMAISVVLLVPSLSRWRSALIDPPIAIETFQLQNGMEVVLFPDSRVPAVTHMLWYRVGAADDYPGRSGLAHYNEHMMFQGTETSGSGEFLQKTASYGGRANAFTNHDYTAYFVTIAKEQLPLIMQMEADRMLHLAPTEENFIKEREVIIEERRTSIENQPGALLAEEMQALLFRNHPYRIPNIGWMHEMQNLTRTDVLAFQKQFYHPANAVLVVAGDITRKELAALAEQHYGTLPAGTPYKRNWAAEPPQRGPRRTELQHANVREPEFSRIYVAPGINDAQQQKKLVLPGFILAQILGGGSSSRLYQSLVVKQKLATSVGVSYDGLSVGPGEMHISAHPARGVTLSQLEAALDKELAMAKNTLPSEEEIVRAKTLLKAETVYARDGNEGMARMLGMLIMQGLPPSYFLDWPEMIERVTDTEVQQSAGAMLDINQSVTGYLLPAAAVEKGAPQ
jgi:zinc protease